MENYVQFAGFDMRSIKKLVNATENDIKTIENNIYNTKMGVQIAENGFKMHKNNKNGVKSDRNTLKTNIMTKLPKDISKFLSLYFN